MEFETNVTSRDDEGHIIGADVNFYDDSGNRVHQVVICEEQQLQDLVDAIEELDTRYVRPDELNNILANAAEDTVINATKLNDLNSASFALRNHNHDDRYYTETEMNTKLNGKANSSHTHTASQISDLTVSTHTLANGAKLYKYGKIVLAVFNNYQYSGKTPNVWTDIFNIPSAYKPISTDNIYGHWSGSTGQIVAGANKIAMYPPQSSGGVFGHILWITS